MKKFTPPQHGLFLGEIDRHVLLGWADSVPQGTSDHRGVVLKNSTFVIVKENQMIRTPR
jgi:hypothetical protein